LWGKIDDMTYTYVDIASLKTLYKKNLYKRKTYTKKRVQYNVKSDYFSGRDTPPDSCKSLNHLIPIPSTHFENVE